MTWSIALGGEKWKCRCSQQTSLEKLSQVLHQYQQEVVNLVEHLNQSPVDALKIKQWTMRDPVLAQVLKFTLQGWPSQVDDENVKPYFTRKEEISGFKEGCLLWGSRG